MELDVSQFFKDYSREKQVHLRQSINYVLNLQIPYLNSGFNGTCMCFRVMSAIYFSQAVMADANNAVSIFFVFLFANLLGTYQDI